MSFIEQTGNCNGIRDWVACCLQRWGSLPFCARDVFEPLEILDAILPPDSQKPLSLSTILSMDGQEIVRGLIALGNPQGYFQATGLKCPESIETATEVLAVVGKQRYHLVRWRRCHSPVGNHFHFELEN